MKIFPFVFSLLFPFFAISSVVGDTGPVIAPGSAAPARKEEDENPEGDPDPAAGEVQDPAPPRTPSVSERVAALLKTRGGLQAQANDLTGKVEQLTTANQDLAQSLSAATARAEAAEAKVKEYETELAKLEQAQQTVSEGVVDQLSQLGVPEAALPESGAGEGGEIETIESLTQQLDQTADPVIAGQIAAKINKLRKAG